MVPSSVEPSSVEPSSVSVLCVCSYNRTRSVMMAALLEHHARELGAPVRVSSAGVRADGGLATVETLKLLSNLGIDLRGHRASPLTDERLDAADLVVTAEHDHVVTIAARRPDAFHRTFTLPELVDRARRVGGRLGGPVADWLDVLDEGRPAGFAYLDAGGSGHVGEIDDPTGLDRRTWHRVFEQVDDLTRTLAQALT
ncbi:MAG: hypothetical protein ACK5CE_15860 [Actinomycetes bacterium]